MTRVRAAARWLRPRAGTAIGMVVGAAVGGSSWLFGALWGLLLGMMVDAIRGIPRGNRPFGDDPSADDPQPDEQAVDPAELAEAYAVLRVEPGASIAEVRRAWRERSMRTHPDAAGGDAEEFLELHRAYEAILERSGAYSSMRSIRAPRSRKRSDIRS